MQHGPPCARQYKAYLIQGSIELLHALGSRQTAVQDGLRGQAGRRQPGTVSCAAGLAAQASSASILVRLLRTRTSCTRFPAVPRGHRPASHLRQDALPVQRGVGLGIHAVPSACAAAWAKLVILELCCTMHHGKTLRWFLVPERCSCARVRRKVALAGAVERTAPGAPPTTCLPAPQLLLRRGPLPMQAAPGSPPDSAPGQSPWQRPRQRPSPDHDMSTMAPLLEL